MDYEKASHKFQHRKQQLTLKRNGHRARMPAL